MFMPSSGVSTSLNYVTQKSNFVKSVKRIIGETYFTNLKCWIWYIKDIASSIYNIITLSLYISLFLQYHYTQLIYKLVKLHLAHARVT
jgi:MFS-type transporter involved in bile tolerance (Atg22 family)